MLIFIFVLLIKVWVALLLLSVGLYLLWWLRKVFLWMALAALTTAAVIWTGANYEGLLGFAILFGAVGGVSTRSRPPHNGPTLEEVRRDALIERVWKPYPIQNHPLPADTIYEYADSPTK